MRLTKITSSVKSIFYQKYQKHQSKNVLLRPGTCAVFIHSSTYDRILIFNNRRSSEFIQLRVSGHIYLIFGYGLQQIYGALMYYGIVLYEN